jgi:hypothetical protein
MKNRSLILSGLVHLANLSTGVIVLILSVSAFGWATYGEISLILAITLLLTQISVLGNPNLMIASLSKLESSAYRKVVFSFTKRIIRPQLTVLLAIMLCIYFMLSTGTEQIANISIFALFAIGASSLVAPINKMLLLSLTLPDTYLRFVVLSLTKNFLITVFLLTSLIMDSKIVILFCLAFAELLLFPALLLGIRNNIKNSSAGNIPFNEVTKGKDEIVVFLITIYFELLAKYDFYIFSFFMNSETFGLYAVISNVNESIQTYLGVVRTQLSPYFTAHNSISVKDPLFKLSLVKLIVTTLFLLGFCFIYFCFKIQGSNFPNWPLIYFLISVSSLVMFKSLIFGNVFVQRSKPRVLAKIGAIHLGLLFLVTTTVFLWLGLVQAICCTIIINFLMSRCVVESIPSSIKGL